VSEAGQVPTEYVKLLEQAQTIRNDLVHRGQSDVEDQELARLADGLFLIAGFVGNHQFSLEVLPILEREYGQCLRYDLVSVRLVVRRRRDTLLEVTHEHPATLDGTTVRIDMEFVDFEDIEPPEVLSDEALFAPDIVTQEKAERLFKELDPFYFLAMGIEHYLFHEEGIEEIRRSFESCSSH
jgi:hypothetical protein